MLFFRIFMIVISCWNIFKIALLLKSDHAKPYEYEIRMVVLILSITLFICSFFVTQNNFKFLGILCNI